MPKERMTVKKTLMLLLAAIMMISLAACGTKNAASPETAQSAEQTNTASSSENTASVEPAGSNTPEDDPDQEETSGNPEETNIEETGRKTLIVYFSPANSDTADAVSSATPRVGDVSSVEYVAQLISARIDADTARVVPETAYPLAYNDAADQAKQERDNGDRPAFTLDVNPEDYETIFVGYPMWWYEMPMIMDTFFDTYDFSGKTIIPFNTHAGSGDGGTYADIAELEPGATVLVGLAVAGERAGNAEYDVNSWLDGLGY